MGSQRVGYDWVTELNWTDSVLDTAEKNCFARQRGPQWTNALKTMNPDQERIVRHLKVFKEQGMVSSWTFFWLVGGEVIRSQHHQPSGFSCLSGIYMLVGSMQSTSPTWWGFQYLQSRSRIWLQILSAVLEEELKTLTWLCLMAEILLFCLAWLFSFLCFLLRLNLFFK